MKKIYNLLFGVSLFIMIAWQCNPNKPDTDLIKSLDNIIEKIEHEKQERPNTYYVIVDKSRSKITSDINREFESFKRCVQHDFKKPADQIVIIHAYENSSNVNNFHRYELSTPYPNLEQSEDFDERQLNVAKYLKSLKQEKDHVFAKIRTKHFEPPANAEASLLLSSLYRISIDIIRTGKKRTGHVLALTDGMEYSSIRAFNAQSPKEAREQGGEDAKKLSKRFDIPTDAFQNLNTVTFQLPSDTIMNTTQQMNFIQEYWEEVFKYLGCIVVPDFGGCF